MESQEFIQRPEAEENAGWPGEKQAKKTFSRIGWGVLAFLVVSSALQILLQILLPEWSQQELGYWICAFGPIYVVGLPVCMLVLGKRPQERVNSQPMKAGRYASFFLIALFIMGAGSIVANLILQVLNEFTGSSVENPVVTMLAGQNLLYTFLISVVIGPVAEEFVFRKLLLDRMFPYGEKLAILVSALLFGLFHGNLSQFFYAFALGVLLGYVYVKTGSVARTMGIHMGINFVCGFLPLLILGNMDLEFFQNLGPEVLQNMDALLTGEVMQKLQWVFTYFVYLFVYFGGQIAGVVLLCKGWKKSSFQEPCRPIPKQRTGAVVFGNVGMILSIVACAALMILALIPRN